MKSIGQPDKSQNGNGVALGRSSVLRPLSRAGTRVALPVARLLGGLLTTVLVNAQSPAALSAAIARLKSLENYSWSTTNQTPGAPFEIPASRGTARRDGMTLRELVVGGHPVKLVTWGQKSVFNSGTAWQSLDESRSDTRRSSPAVDELADTRRPDTELEALSAALVEIKETPDGGFEGVIDVVEAKSIMTSLVRHHAPRPGMEISKSTGTVRIWIQGGMPEKYVLKTTGELALPFGRKTITKITTVKFAGCSEKRLEIPVESLSKLDYPGK